MEEVAVRRKLRALVVSGVGARDLLFDSRGPVSVPSETPGRVPLTGLEDRTPSTWAIFDVHNGDRGRCRSLREG